MGRFTGLSEVVVAGAVEASAVASAARVVAPVGWESCPRAAVDVWLAWGLGIPVTFAGE